MHSGIAIVCRSVAGPKRHVLRAALSSVSLLALVSAAVAPAAAETWSGATSTDWTVASNWGGTVPTTGAVTINTTSPNHTVLGVSGAANGTSGNMFVGDGGTGSLTIQNGSTLTTNANAFSFIGRGTGSVGVVNVTGPGSKWIINGTPGLVSFLLGENRAAPGATPAPTGTLNISNGGAVQTAGDLVVGETSATGILSVTSGGTLTTGRDVYIGRLAGSNGTATIDGSGSRWTIASRLLIGNGGPGALTISNNALVDVATSTTVGDSASQGTFNINSGGVLQTQTLVKGTGAVQVNFDNAILRAKATSASFITGFTGTELSIAPGGLTVDTAGFNVTSTAPFSGAGALTKTGTGTLTIGNVASTYTGGTTLSQSSLVFGGNSALGAGTVTLGDSNTGASNLSLLANFPNFASGQNINNNIVVSGSGSGTVSIGSTTFGAGSNGTIYGGTITLNRDVTLVGGNTDRTSFYGKITGTGNITSTGSRVTLLNDTNDFVGSFTIAPGNVLQTDRAFVLPRTTTLNILGALQFANTSHQTIDGLNGPSTAVIQIITGARPNLAVGAANGSGTYAAVIPNVLSSFTKLGTGTQILSGANTYNAVTRISGGILSVPLLADGGAASGIGISTNAATNLVLDGGTLQHTGAAASTNRQFTLTTNGGGIDASGSGALNFTSTAAIVLSGTGSRTLTLTGSNSAANTLAAPLGDNGGPSSLVKTGFNTWVLTGNGSYTGGTILNAGTLRVSANANLGDTAGALTFNGGTLQNTAAFSAARTVTINSGGGAFQTDADLTLSGAVSGVGALTKTGAGTLVLTAADSYTGGTTISAGALQLGSGGASGSIVGDVTNNAVLVFNRSDALGLSGMISGTGTVSQTGTGTTTLTGVNSYSGGTTISAGTLTGSATSFGSGAVLDNAALVVDQPADASFANAINGTGSFTKLGKGRLDYIGTGDLTGNTTVAAGILAVNGSLASSNVTVQNGGTLGGNGTVGATAIQSGGTIAPGNSIGTLHINGAFTQASGSIYQVEVDPNTDISDRIAVTGTAALQSGAGLNVSKSVPGDYRVGTVYTVLTSTGGLTGTYTLSGQTQGVSAFLALRDSYDANNAYLTVVQTQPLANAATTPNQQAVADALPPATPVTTAVLNSPDIPAAQSAFDQLSGQIQASAKSALAAHAIYVRDATFDRLRDTYCDEDRRERPRPGCSWDGPSLWAQGYGGWGGVSGNANAAGINHSTAGFLIGFDVPVADWRVGLFGGRSQSDLHLTATDAVGETTDFHLGAYAGTRWDNISLRLGASYSWDGITADRSVAFGSFRNQLRSVYKAGTSQGFAELGYRMAMWDIRFEPFANLAYINVRTDDFREVGGPAALTVRADTLENLISTLGVRPSTDIIVDGAELTLRGLAGWRHTFGSVTPRSTMAFAGGSDFTITGAPLARDAMALEAGMDFTVRNNISAGLTYGSQLSSRTTDQTLRGTIRVAF